MKNAAARLSGLALAGVLGGALLLGGSVCRAQTLTTGQALAQSQAELRQVRAEVRRQRGVVQALTARVEGLRGEVERERRERADLEARFRAEGREQTGKLRALTAGCATVFGVLLLVLLLMLSALRRVQPMTGPAPSIEPLDALSERVRAAEARLRALSREHSD